MKQRLFKKNLRNITPILLTLVALFSKRLFCEQLQYPNFRSHKGVPTDPAKRSSSYPYISPDTFRAICDFVIDETNIPFDTDDIKDGDIIFVRNNKSFLDLFFEKAHPLINARYILISHSGNCEKERYKKYLDDEKIVVWYGKNLVIDHPKAFTLPLGIPNNYWGCGDTAIIDEVRNNLPNISKNKFLYMNFSILINSRDQSTRAEYRDRMTAYKYLRNKSFCSKSPKKAYKEYLQDLAESKFVLSPRGVGMDCYKTWKTFLMGSIPVISATKLNKLFDDLPVVIVEDFSTITKEFLDKKYEEISKKKYNLKKIWADYWINQINGIKEKVKNQKNENPYINQAEIFVMLNKIDAALLCYEKAAKEDPSDHTILIKIAHLYSKIKKTNKFLSYLKKSIEVNPDDFKTCFYIGYTLQQKGKNEEALLYYKRALEINKNIPAAWYNAALLLRKKEKIDDSINFYKKAIALSPKREAYRFGLAQAYLASGNFKDGWKEMDLGRMSILSKFKNRLKNRSEIQGKTIFIPKSWGMGDVMQFVRFAKYIKEHGGTVLMQVHKPVAKILSSCKYVDKITTTIPDKSEYDMELSLWSLPHIFNTTIGTIPNEIPYLYADPTLVHEWEKKLQNDKNFKIGLCWQGSSTGVKKDIKLEKFKPLAHIPGISLYSLQKGRGQKQTEAVSFAIADFGKELDEENGSFMDTAAIMKNIDLVITVDTSIAHLAGALGVPVLVLLPFGPDWRWMLGRTDSPWYPTMKLFRQKKRGNWKPVIQEIKKNVERMLYIS